MNRYPTFQPSASWSWLLIECAYSFAQSFDRVEAGEPARYGSAFHEIAAADLDNRPLLPKAMRGVAERWGVTEHFDELTEHTALALRTLKGWLQKNEFRVQWGLKAGRHVEVAVALDPLKGARFIQGHNKDHVYEDLLETEQPGTLDLALAHAKTPLLVIDHKTGEEDFRHPLDKAQLLSLAAAMMRITRRKEAIVGALWARRRGLPKVYAEKVKLVELTAYEGRVKKGLAQVGDGSLRPGPWCQRCPARYACPAKDADLLARAGDVLTGLTAAGGALSKQGLTANDVALVKVPPGGLSVERRLGHLYDVVRKGEALAERARAEIKAAIIAAEGQLLPVTADGKYLVVRSFEKESLGKKSIIDAYGKIKGERLIAKLRKDGAINKSRVEQLWPESDR